MERQRVVLEIPRWCLTLTAGLALLSVAGCGEETTDTSIQSNAQYDGAVPAELYAGDVRFRMGHDLSTQQGPVPIALYLGTAPETQTRMRGQGVVDLRDVQMALPNALSRSLEPSCGIGLDVDFHGAEAVEDRVVAAADVDVRLYRCRDRDTETEARGARLLTQPVAVTAEARAVFSSTCLRFEVTGLELTPRGFLGGLATLFGLTERARSAILTELETLLENNPICPDVPPALQTVDLHVSDLALQEIGEGGIGARAAASIDVNAENIVDLMALAEASSPSDEGTRLEVIKPLDLKDSDIDISLDLTLIAETDTRLRVSSLLDLRAVQAVASDKVAVSPIVDVCGGRVTMDSLDTAATGTNVAATGRATLENFECLRTGPGSWQRGPLLGSETLGVRAEMTAVYSDKCVVFSLLDLQRDPPGAVAEQVDMGDGRLAAARALMLEATRLYLEATPLCPELPPEIDILAPKNVRAVPQEIGTGGVGMSLDGSIDVSPQTLVALMQIFQQRGVLPPTP